MPNIDYGSITIIRPSNFLCSMTAENKISIIIILAMHVYLFLAPVKYNPRLVILFSIPDLNGQIKSCLIFSLDQNIQKPANGNDVENSLESAMFSYPVLELGVEALKQ